MSKSDDLMTVVIEAVQEEFEQKAKELEELMGDEINSKEGTLKSCMTHEKLSDTSYFVGIDGDKLKRKSKNHFDYSMAYWKGRKEVRPIKANALHWQENGQDVFAKKAKATSGDPFVERAIAKFK